MHVKFGAAALSILAVVLALGVIASATTSTAAASGTKLEGDLNPAAGLASGEAEFESRSDRTRFTAEVEDTAIACDQLHVFHVASSTDLGAMAADGDGNCDLNLDTRGEDTVPGDSVPGMAAGDSIEVRQGATVVVSGTLTAK